MTWWMALSFGEECGLYHHNAELEQIQHRQWAYMLFSWLMRPTDLDVFKWDLFCLSLFCIWMTPTANLKIKAAKSNQTTESDGNIDIWNQTCSLNKEQLFMHSGFWSTLNLKSAFSQTSSLTSESTQLLYTTTPSCAKQPTAHKDWLFLKTFKIIQPYKNVLSSLKLFMSAHRLLVCWAPG